MCIVIIDVPDVVNVVLRACNCDSGSLSRNGVCLSICWSVGQSVTLSSTSFGECNDFVSV